MKRCLWCDKELVQREGEWPSNFEPRQYCDRFCSAKHIGDKRKVSKVKPKRGEGIFFRRDPDVVWESAERKHLYRHNRLENVNA